MDRSAVKAIVDKHCEPLMERLGIPHWRIVVSYEPGMANEHGRAIHGDCTWLVDYNQAAIRLNPEQFDTEAEVLKTLRHELLHVVASPLSVYHGTVGPLLDQDPLKRAMVESLRTYVIEQTIINLERMYGGLTHREPKLKVAKPKPKKRK